MIRYKKQPMPTGLAAVGASPRGYDLWDGPVIVATISPELKDRFNIVGWYFYMLDNGPHYNSYSDGLNFKELNEAKKACKEKYLSRRMK